MRPLSFGIKQFRVFSPTIRRISHQNCVANWMSAGIKILTGSIQKNYPRNRPSARDFPRFGKPQRGSADHFPMSGNIFPMIGKWGIRFSNPPWNCSRGRWPQVSNHWEFFWRDEQDQQDFSKHWKWQTAEVPELGIIIAAKERIKRKKVTTSQNSIWTASQPAADLPEAETFSTRSSGAKRDQ